MIGNEDNAEEPTFKVTDRRKFNPDGTVKEGVIIEESKVATRRDETTESTIAVEDVAALPNLSQEESSVENLDPDDIPGADDPASFVNFLSTLATNAAASLGAVPHPATGKLSVDLDTGKYWLDVLGMIKTKTAGNLHDAESRLLEGLLADLRMQYVTMVRATEEKLKAQAAKKFSNADILGKNS